MYEKCQDAEVGSPLANGLQVSDRTTRGSETLIAIETFGSRFPVPGCKSPGPPSGTRPGGRARLANAILRTFR